MFIRVGLFDIFCVLFLEGIYMSNSNPFGGELKKVLASMCSLFVGASDVSQAVPISLACGIF